jgi:hypothetical protein
MPPACQPRRMGVPPIQPRPIIELPADGFPFMAARVGSESSIIAGLDGQQDARITPDETGVQRDRTRAPADP